MRRLCALVLPWMVLATACRRDFDAQDASASGTGGTTGAETESGTGGGTETGDPFETCETCQVNECAAYQQACDADPDCADCTQKPFGLGCASNENFRRLANCSCFSCGDDCVHMCPPGANCQSCGLTECNAQTQACTQDSVCFPCLDDPYAENCADSDVFQTFRDCACDLCAQPCVWTCEAAFPDCAGCAAGMCGAEYAACLADQTCKACSENPLAPGCMENPLAMAAQACVCASCEPVCGILFACE